MSTKLSFLGSTTFIQILLGPALFALDPYWLLTPSFAPSSSTLCFRFAAMSLNRTRGGKGGRARALLGSNIPGPEQPGQLPLPERLSIPERPQYDNEQLHQQQQQQQQQHLQPPTQQQHDERSHSGWVDSVLRKNADGEGVHADDEIMHRRCLSSPLHPSPLSSLLSPRCSLLPSSSLTLSALPPFAPRADSLHKRQMAMHDASISSLYFTSKPFQALVTTRSYRSLALSLSHGLCLRLSLSLILPLSRPTMLPIYPGTQAGYVLHSRYAMSSCVAEGAGTSVCGTDAGCGGTRLAGTGIRLAGTDVRHGGTRLYLL
eukprot:2658401-Rhodomonas_salina.1